MQVDPSPLFWLDFDLDAVHNVAPVTVQPAAPDAVLRNRPNVWHDGTYHAAAGAGQAQLALTMAQSHTGWEEIPVPSSAHPQERVGCACQRMTILFAVRIQGIAGVVAALTLAGARASLPLQGGWGGVVAHPVNEQTEVYSCTRGSLSINCCDACWEAAAGHARPAAGNRRRLATSACRQPSSAPEAAQKKAQSIHTIRSVRGLMVGSVKAPTGRRKQRAWGAALVVRDGC